MQGRPYQRELDGAVAAAVRSGAAVRDLYDRAAANAYAKLDGSVVTDADLASDRVLRAELAAGFPADAILTEEGVDDAIRLDAARCWVVDPIDGTEQFVRRTGDFDVLVALVEAGRPVVAVAYQPTAGLLCAATRGGGAWVRRGDELALEPVRLEALAPDSSPVLASTIWFGGPENAVWLDGVADACGGTSAGVFETGLSPRLFLEPRRCDAMLGFRIDRADDDQPMAWEWDFAVSDLFFHEAGGVVTDLAAQLFRYNKPVPRNQGGLVAAVDPVTHARVLAAVREITNGM